MANNLIQIRRSNTSSTPTTILAGGELAFSYNSNNLFIGAQSGVGSAAVKIAGAKYGYLDNFTTPGTLYANATIITDSNSFISNTFTSGLAIQGSSTSVPIIITSISNSYSAGQLGSITSGGSGTELVTSYAVQHYIDAVAIAATTPAGSNQQFQYNDSGVIAGTSNFTYDNTTGTITVGNTASHVHLGYISGIQATLESQGNQNNYVQIAHQNSNTGTSASTDFAAYNDDGSYATFIDMGINSSTWSNTQWTINGGNDGYLYTGGGNLAIGTNAASKEIVFFTGGTLAANERFRVKDDGVVIKKGIYANGSLGSSGQILSSNSTGGIYWMTAGSVGTNTDAQYTWSNTQTFQNTITFSSTINGTANNALYLGGVIASSYATQTFVTSQGYITSAALTGYATETYASDKAANAYSNAISYASDKAANAYSNAMSNTLSRSATYTGNNVFSGANTTFSGTNINVTGFLTAANSNIASIKVRDYALQGGSYDRNQLDLGLSAATLIGGNYGVQLKAANDGVNFFTLSLSGDDGSLAPSANGTMDLGTTDKRFGKLYLAGSTIVIGNSTISVDSSNNVVIDRVLANNVTVNNIIGTTTNISSNLVITSANVDMTSSLLRTRDAVVSGNLTINGTLTTIDTNNLSVKDSNIKLADQNTTSDTLDFGFYGLYNTSSTQYYSGLFRDHSVSTATNPIFHLFTSTTEPTGIVDTTAGGYHQGTLQAYLDTGAFIANSSAVSITANSSVSVGLVANSLTLSSALAASYGGTGQTSYTAGDLLYASGSTALSKLSIPGSAANGQVLMVTNNLPAYGTLDGGTF